ncbi:MAG: transposase [Chloroflexota bacterium]|nr:transposase [Chloroflexota bacterium]
MLLGEDPQSQRHQVTELPRIEPHVTEYRRHTLTCLVCGSETTGACPADMPPGDFGPRLQATTGYLSGRMGMSQRDSTETMAVVFHTDISLGSVPALETVVRSPRPTRRRRSTLCPASSRRERGRYGLARASETRLAVGCADPAGVRLSRPRHPRRQRRTPIVRRDLSRHCRFRLLVGIRLARPATAATVLSAAEGWAHLKRDSLCEKLVERGRESQRLGEAFLVQVEQLFRLWQRVRDGTLNRQDFQTQIARIRTHVHDLLCEGAALTQEKTRHTCTNLLKVEPALWTFVHREGVEPTNNHAERCLRRAVCFGVARVLARKVKQVVAFWNVS